MLAIEFNHNYKKLHNQTSAKLLYSEVRYGRNLNENFVEYDTENHFKINEDEQYLVLYFQGDDLIPFTTLRKANDENFYKYQKGEVYIIVIEEKKTIEKS